MNEAPLKRYFYNGTFMPEHEVPLCKFCVQKAHGTCIKCNTPICYEHECHTTEQRICHYCRLIDWVQIQKG